MGIEQVQLEGTDKETLSCKEKHDGVNVQVGELTLGRVREIVLVSTKLQHSFYGRGGGNLYRFALEFWYESS